MISFVLAPFLMLLSVFGHYLAQPQPTRPYPSALTRPILQIATTTASTTPSRATTTPAKKPAVVAASKDEPRPTPQPQAAANTNFIADAEAAVFARMNAERTQEGLPPFSFDAALSSLSRAHSADMITQKYFSHVDPLGCGSACRANAASYAWQAIGENIYMSSGYELSATLEAEMVVEGWMHSSGHRANILGSQYSHAGVGIVQQGESVYVTAMYSKPR